MKDLVWFERKGVSGLNVRMKGLVRFERKVESGFNPSMQGLVWFKRKVESGLNVRMKGLVWFERKLSSIIKNLFFTEAPRPGQFCTGLLHDLNPIICTQKQIRNCAIPLVIMESGE